MEIKTLQIPENNSDPITIFEGKAPSPLPPYDYQGFQYKTLDVKSFCKIVEAKGKPCNAVIFGNGEGFHAILDDEVTDRAKDTVTMPFTYSVQMNEWAPVLEDGHVFKLKELIDYIKRSDNQTI